MNFVIIFIYFLLGSFSQNLLAHQTILGFEKTLTNEEKKRFRQFVIDQKEQGYTSCFYVQHEDTVGCQNQAREINLFR